MGVIIGKDRVRMEKKKSSGSDRVASVKECEGCAEVFGIGKLL